VSPATEITLIAVRELKKSTRSIKGIILGVLTLLGSALAVLICIWAESTQRTAVGAENTEALRMAYEQAAIKGGTDPDVAHLIAQRPISLILFLKVMVWFGPILVALLGFDSIAGELQHKSIRYWTIRSRRWTYLLGKFFGLWGIVSAITLALTLISSTCILIARYMTFGDFFAWGLRCWLISAMIVGAWAAVATFVSSRFKTPIYALLTTFGAFFCMFVPYLIGLAMRVGDVMTSGSKSAAMKAMGDIRWFEYLYPNNYDDLLLSPKPSHVAEGIGACAVYMIVFVGLSSALFAKKDV
jgi:ABC-type transport system involved in multi-copper enzyme maturation permease subunit